MGEYLDYKKMLILAFYVLKVSYMDMSNKEHNRYVKAASYYIP